MASCRISFDQELYLFNISEISPVLFVNNCEFVKNFVVELNKRIENERKKIVALKKKSACEIICLVIFSFIAVITLIGLIPFLIYINNQDKKLAKTNALAKLKINRFISENLSNFNQRGLHVVFKEEVLYGYKGETIKQFFLDFTIGQPLNVQNRSAEQPPVADPPTNMDEAPVVEMENLNQIRE